MQIEVSVNITQTGRYLGQGHSEVTHALHSSFKEADCR